MTTKKPPKKKPGGGIAKSAMKHPHPGGVTMTAALDAAVGAAVDEKPSIAALRWRAKMMYVQDPNQISTTDLAALPEFKSVGYEHIKTWCTTDGWVAERQKFWDVVRAKFQEAMADRIVQRRIALLEKIRPVIDKVVDTFLPHAYVAPDESEIEGKVTWKTQCKVCGRKKLGHDDPFYGDTGSQRVGALAKLVELDLTLAADIVRNTARAASEEGTSGNAGLNGTDPPLLPDLSPEEARIAAHAVIRKRRAALFGDVDGAGVALTAGGDDDGADAADGDDEAG